MSSKIVYASLLSSSLSLFACIDAPSDGSRTARNAEETSALSGGNIWTDDATGLCLDSDGGGSAYTHFCNGGDFQIWNSFVLGGNVFIADQHTGMCLDSDNAGNVYTKSCNHGVFQQWTITDTGGFHYEIRNAATGRCLDSNFEGQLYAFDCNGGNFQRWHVPA